MSTDVFDITFADGYVTPGRRRNKLDGTTAPTANDDAGDGYEVGSFWVDTTNDIYYVCVDSTATAAVWKQTSSGGGSSLDWVIVTDATYGAVGDDATDDTTAIQAAISATPSGGVCYFPAGTYKITSTLTLSDPIHLMGTSVPKQRGTAIKFYTANDVLIEGPTTGAEHWTMSGLHLLYAGTTPTSGAAVHTTQSLLARDCNITGGFYDNIVIETDGTAADAVYFSILDDVWSDDAIRNALRLVGNVNNCTVMGGRYNLSATGIEATGGPLGLRILAAAIENNTTSGIKAEGSGTAQNTAGILISGCYFEQADGLIDVDLGPSSLVYSVRVESSVFIKSNLSGTGYHIDADNVDGLTVADCYFTSDDVITTTANTDAVVWSNNHNVNAGTVTLPSGEHFIVEPAASVAPEDVGTTAAGTSPYPARADHIHGGGGLTPDGVKAAGRWEPVQYDDGSSPWPFVYFDDEIVVAWVET